MMPIDYQPSEEKQPFFPPETRAQIAQSLRKRELVVLNFNNEDPAKLRSKITKVVLTELHITPVINRYAVQINEDGKSGQVAFGVHRPFLRGGFELPSIGSDHP